MKTPDQGLTPPTREQGSEPKLKEVYEILSTNADMICKMQNETLFFSSEYEEEQQALAAEQKLRELGLSSIRKGTALLLTAQFSKDEIEASKKYTTLIA